MWLAHDGRRDRFLPIENNTHSVVYFLSSYSTIY